MKIDQYRKIQEYRELGLSQKKTAEKLELTLFEVRKVWEINEETFRTCIHKRFNRVKI